MAPKFFRFRYKNFSGVGTMLMAVTGCENNPQRYNQGLQVLTEITKVHDSVKPGLAENHQSSHFVEKDVVVERQHFYKAHPPHQCDGVPQDEEENDDRIEVQAKSIRPREHEEVVWLGAITLVPSPVRKE